MMAATSMAQASVMSYRFTAEFTGWYGNGVFANGEWKYTDETDNFIGDFFSINRTIDGTFDFSTEGMRLTQANDYSEYYENSGISNIKINWVNFRFIGEHNTFSITSKSRNSFASFNTTNLSSNFKKNSFTLTDLLFQFHEGVETYSRLEDINFALFTDKKINFYFTKFDQYENEKNAYFISRPEFKITNISSMTIPEPSTGFLIAGLLLISLIFRNIRNNLTWLSHTPDIKNT